MDVEDRVVLTTPEGVTVDLVLAGLGSRFTAALIDSIVRILLAVAVLLATSATDFADGWGAAYAAIAFFLLTFGYDVLFEVCARGRTIGKRLCGIRVVDRDGGPVGFVTSVVRNVVRIIDMLPGFYLVGSIALIVSSKNQRLGDMAAGTYVVRERATPPPVAWTPPDLGEKVSTWDVTQVTSGEIATVRQFLERRDELLPDARRKLATGLAGQLRTKVSGPDDWLGDEMFLEHLVAAKSR